MKCHTIDVRGAGKAWMKVPFEKQSILVPAVLFLVKASPILQTEGCGKSISDSKAVIPLSRRPIEFLQGYQLIENNFQKK